MLTFVDLLSFGSSIILLLLFGAWLTWRIEPTWKAFEGMIEILADATRF